MSHGIAFDVIGVPVAQGSKRAFVRGGKPVMVEMGVGHADWRAAVADTARMHAPESPLDGPLALDVTFRFPMPASRPKAVRAKAEAGAEVPKVYAPDLDKLIRALGDGLQAGGLIRDDARIVAIAARKVEVIGWTGCSVSVRALDAEGERA